MSVVDGKVVVMDTCYKCEEPLNYDALDNVHPLCDECQDDFDSWFTSQIAMLDNA
jgi:hypothetical protein